MNPSMQCLSAALVLAAACGGCSRLTVEQQDWLRQGQEAYEAKQYSRAIEQMGRFLETELDQPETMKALYYKGLAEAYRGDRGTAMQDLRHATALALDPTMTWRAHVALGSMYFEDRKWSEAADAFANAAAIMPQQTPKDVVLYKQGLARERSGRWAEATAPYEQIIAEFPDGNLARTARRRLDTQADHFAVQVGEFAVPSNADNLVFRLEQEGLRPRIYPELSGPKTVYVVTIGRYSSFEDADAATARALERFPEAKVWP